MKKCMLSLVMVALMVSAVGCNNPRANLVASDKIFASTVRQLTLLQQLGRFDPNETAQLTIVIHEGTACLEQWHVSVLDPNVPAPNAVNCVSSALLKLQAIKNQKVKELPPELQTAVLQTK